MLKNYFKITLKTAVSITSALPSPRLPSEVSKKFLGSDQNILGYFVLYKQVIKMVSRKKYLKHAFLRIKRLL